MIQPPQRHRIGQKNDTETFSFKTSMMVKIVLQSPRLMAHCQGCARKIRTGRGTPEASSHSRFTRHKSPHPIDNAAFTSLARQPALGVARAQPLP